MDVNKVLDDCIFKVRLMKKHAEKDLIRLTHLHQRLEIIKSRIGGGKLENGSKEES